MWTEEGTNLNPPSVEATPALCDTVLILQFHGMLTDGVEKKNK